MDGNFQSSAGGIPRGETEAVVIATQLAPQFSASSRGHPEGVPHAGACTSPTVSVGLGSGGTVRGPDPLPVLAASPTPQLDQVLAQLESLSYNLSHSLRAPLRSIHGFAQLVLQDYREGIGTGGQDYLQRIMSAAVHMDQLVQQVLAFHQLLYSQLKLEPLDLNRVMQRLIKLQPERTLPICEVRLPETLPAVVGNELALKLCLSNWLISLARYYPPDLAPRLRLWAELKDTRVRLWLSSLESGLGLEEEHLLHSAYLSAAKTDEITDLGLAVVRKATQAMNGQTGVEFIAGQGLQFWVEMPAI